MKIKYALVDDNNFLTHSTAEKLSFFSEFEMRFSASDGEECLQKLELNPRVDVVLMDIEMPGMNGIVATENIKKRYPQIKIIMLTVFDNDELIFNAIKAGADGYLLKDTDAETLRKDILETINGGAAMTPSIAQKTLRLLRNPTNMFTVATSDFELTCREIEVLEQLSTGMSYTKIASNLFLSPNTVRKHIENIYRKLQVHSKLEAIDKAKKNNLI